MSQTTADFKPWSRTQMAARAAGDIPEGWYVNLGIGIPTLIADHVPTEKEVVFHSENGILGVGPQPGANEIEPWIDMPPRRQFCHDPRRPSGPVRPRRLPSRR